MTTAYRPPVDTYAGIPPMHTINLFNDKTITLPRGNVVIFYGPAGVGKGRLTCNFAARNSRGENAAGEPGTTIMITPEDPPGETVAWRLRAEEADLDRVIDMTTLDGGAKFRLDAPGAGRAMSQMAASIAAGSLRSKIDKLAAYDEKQRRLGVTDPALLANPNLVIIESLLAVVDATHINGDASARHVLAPLTKIAEETGVTFLITTHTEKGGRDIAGSRALINAPRLVYEMSNDPDHANVKRITLRKGNSLLAGGTSQFAITGDGTSARVAWILPAATESAAPAVAGWRMRAMQGPLTAIAGAHTAPVPDFTRMTDEERIGHLEEMHGMPDQRAKALRKTPGYLRETLIQLHKLGSDDALTPHRHAARPMLALTAGRAPAGEDDTTREPRQPAVQVFVAPPVPNGASDESPVPNGTGDESRPAPSAAGTAASRGAQQSPPPARGRKKRRR